MFVFPADEPKAGSWRCVCTQWVSPQQSPGQRSVPGSCSTVVLSKLGWRRTRPRWQRQAGVSCRSAGSRWQCHPARTAGREGCRQAGMQVGACCTGSLGMGQSDLLGTGSSFFRREIQAALGAPGRGAPWPGAGLAPCSPWPSRQERQVRGQAGTPSFTCCCAVPPGRGCSEAAHSKLVTAGVAPRCKTAQTGSCQAVGVMILTSGETEAGSVPVNRYWRCYGAGQLLVLVVG